MATFEQALDAAFEVAWVRGQDVDRVRAKFGANPEKSDDELLVEGVNQTFIGAVNTLAALLHLAGRIGSFETTPWISEDGEALGDSPTWADGSSATVNLLVEWAHDNGRMDDAEYAAWKAVSTRHSPLAG
jgi:hypothetical protein